MLRSRWQDDFTPQPYPFPLHTLIKAMYDHFGRARLRTSK